jgi:hypothetical protein
VSDRDKFEAWVLSEDWPADPLERRIDGNYSSVATFYAFRAWQACMLNKATDKSWLPIEIAPKTPFETIILGYQAVDGWAGESNEGYWSPSGGEWRASTSPEWIDQPQPTHWMPLPEPPKGGGQ